MLLTGCVILFVDQSYNIYRLYQIPLDLLLKMAMAMHNAFSKAKFKILLAEDASEASEKAFKCMSKRYLVFHFIQTVL